MKIGQEISKRILEEVIHLSFETPTHECTDNIKICLQETMCGCVLNSSGSEWRPEPDGNEPAGSVSGWEVHEQLRNYALLSIRYLLHVRT